MNGTWQEDLLEFLIGGGTLGRNQSDLLRRFQNRATAEMILNELEFRQIEKKIQKFSIPPPGKIGRPATVWRATTALVEEHNEGKEDSQTISKNKVKKSEKTKVQDGVSVEARRRKRPAKDL